MRFTFGLVAALVGAFAAASTEAQAQKLMQPVLPYALALEAAQAAIASCAARGWTVIVVVLDNYGEEQVLLRPESVYEVNHTDQARRKAYTALTGRPSAAMMNLMDTDPNAYARAAYVDPRITPQAGGLPIKIGDVTVGALGVTGAGTLNGVRGGLNDESCAAAGIAKIQDRLK